MGNVKKCMSPRLCITRGLDSSVCSSPKMLASVKSAIHRFRLTDWGDLSEGDIRLNDEAFQNKEGGILAKYPTPEGPIYISLDYEDEAAGGLALVMFADEY